MNKKNTELFLRPSIKSWFKKNQQRLLELIIRKWNITIFHSTDIFYSPNVHYTPKIFRVLNESVSKADFTGTWLFEGIPDYNRGLKGKDDAIASSGKTESLTLNYHHDFS